MQITLSERLKFLTEHFKLSARKFSREIGVPENNTQNYLPPNPREPGASYLEKIMLRFESVNAHWLLTGEGTPFRSETEDPRGIYQTGQNNSGNMVGVNHGTMSQVHEAGGKKIYGGQHIGKVGRDAIQNHGASASEVAAMQRELELLRSQVADKERTIQILLNQQPKP